MANLKERLGKVKAAVTQILTCARSEIMRKIEIPVLLKLHETVTMPTLLYGSETWALNASELKQVDRMELWALKKMLGLPPTTPTAAVRFMSGTLFTDIRIQKKQLVYLHSLLQKEDGHWAKDSLHLMRQNNARWSKNMEITLTTWELCEEWDRIASKTKNTWRKEVEAAAENMNKTKMLEECQIKKRGIPKPKTKTTTVIEKIEDRNYHRNPSPLLRELTSLEARALIMGRYGMLDCKANFSMGYGGKYCHQCNAEDDEGHRINDCVRFRNINRHHKVEKIDFDKLYSDKLEHVLPVIKSILSMWDLEHGKNKMKES